MKKLVLVTVASLGMTAIAAQSQTGGNAGARDPYTQGAKSGTRDPYTDGAKSGSRDPYTDGAKVGGKFDAFTQGAHTSSNLVDDSEKPAAVKQKKQTAKPAPAKTSAD